MGFASLYPSYDSVIPVFAGDDPGLEKAIPP